MLTIQCPTCRKEGSVPEEFLGKSVRCKKCNTNFVVQDSTKGNSSESSQDPREYAAGRGHPEFPCLSKTYSPGSRIPCTDFSPWLLERIREDDRESVANFVWEVVQANPGVGIGSDGFREYWKDAARKVFTYDLHRHLSGVSDAVFAELRAALVLILLHDNFGGFVMASHAPKYLATLMFPHVFAIRDTEELVSSANAFICHMRKDTPFWEDFPLYEVATIDPWTLPIPNEHREFLRILGTLPLASRMHVFDFTFRNEIRGPSAAHIAEKSTSYPTRQRGIDVVQSTKLLFEAGLLVQSEDPADILKRLKVQELKDLLTAEGASFVGGLKKADLVALASRECPQGIAKLREGVFIARLSPRYLPSITWAHEHIERSVPFFQVWLGFGVDKRNLIP